MACPSCGRHVKKDEARCPFCGQGGGLLRRAVVVAAFFGSAAIPGCAYGPGVDDFTDADDTTASEVMDATGEVDEVNEITAGE